MDTMNKTMLPQDNLTYNYKSDPMVKIGVLGMVDDNIGISKYGVISIKKKCFYKHIYRSTKAQPIRRKKVF